MPKGAVNISGRKALTGALVAHLSGRVRPENARTRDGQPAVVAFDADGQVIGQEAADAMLDHARQRHRKLAADHRGEKRRGPRPTGLRSAVVRLPGVPPDQILEAAGRSVRWLGERVFGPGSTIATAHLHQDEATDHLHLTAVVATPDGRMAWEDVQDASPIPANHGPRFLSAVQTDFHERVGADYGIDRGGRAHAAAYKLRAADPDGVRRLEADLAAERESHARTRLLVLEFANMIGKDRQRDGEQAFARCGKRLHKRGPGKFSVLDAAPARAPAPARTPGPSR